MLPPLPAMRAVARSAYGPPDVLGIRTLPTPQPGPGEVLVRVHAGALGRGDLYFLSGKPYLVRAMMGGLRRPAVRSFGQDFAGTVAALGADVTGFAPGDAVFGQVAVGALADYVCVPSTRVAHAPRSIPLADAAALPDSALTALQGLRDVGRLQPGESVLINGASGGVGTAAVQIAKAMGATVTAVCSTRHIARVRALGADTIVDYTTEDIRTYRMRFDVLLDLAGTWSIGDRVRLLTPRGRLVSSSAGPDAGHWLGPIFWLLQVPLRNLVVRQRLAILMMQPTQADLALLAEMVDAGRLAPVITRRFALEETAAAVRDLAAGHAEGKTVIDIAA